MTNHVCVAVGINRYQFLRPLSYGQADAQALQQLLVWQANLPSEQCLLLTDSSPPVSEYSTYPSRDNILHWVGMPSQNLLLAEHWRWFFFSGYGVSWQEVDYLMPIDGNPDDITGTGIPVRSLFESLKTHDNDKILVLLDINRSPGPTVGGPVGAETVELAEQMGIALVLSSQLNQYSHEAAALGKGLFTTALLEALRYYHTDTTLESLEEYLRERLPELSQHHWRPLQTPLTVIPSQKTRAQLILPSVHFLAQERTGMLASSKLDLQEIRGGDYPNGTAPTSPNIVVPTPPRGLNTSSIQTTPHNSHPVPSKPGAMVPSTDSQSESEMEKTPWWQQRLLLWGVGILASGLLAMALVLRIQDNTDSEQLVEATNSEAVPTASPTATVQQPTAPQQQPINASQNPLVEAKSLIEPIQASSFSKAIDMARKVQPDDPLYQQAQQDISRWSQVMMDIAEGRAQKENFGGAIAAAKMIPQDDSSVHQKAQEAMVQWQDISLNQRNQELIQKAKQAIKPNQVASYQGALTTLSQVKPEQPGYDEVQQLKAQWSDQIYLIANTLAAQGKFQEAVEIAKSIPQGTPSSEKAKQAITNWSDQIYLIANTLAAQGKFQEAVEIAKSIPQDTPSSEKAKQAIAKWEQNKR
ncbi:MAG: peptidase C14 [Symploca sp. SIO2E6]|nr:peptidase C14 [Symploca sp. SIO2E6]